MQWIRHQTAYVWNTMYVCLIMKRQNTTIQNVKISKYLNVWYWKYETLHYVWCKVDHSMLSAGLSLSGILILRCFCHQDGFKPNELIFHTKNCFLLVAEGWEAAALWWKVSFSLWEMPCPPGRNCFLKLIKQVCVTFYFIGKGGNHSDFN